jgi:hypothetical protein
VYVLLWAYESSPNANGCVCPKYKKTPADAGVEMGCPRFYRNWLRGIRIGIVSGKQ